MSLLHPSGHGRWARRVPLFGALIILTMIAMAAFDVLRSHGEAVAETGRQLDTQARIIAEQTARSLQAVDVMLRHVAEQYRQGALERLTPRELHNYLGEQAVGLVQIDGLLMADATGRLWASSRTFPVPEKLPSFAGRPAFEKLRAGSGPGVVIESAVQSDELRIWVFPIGRRLETSSGGFAGVIGARGRIDYYQKFYRDIQLGPGTITALMHQNGTLLAREPAADALLGKRLPLFDERLAAYNRGSRGAFRTVSPVDGVERIGAMQLVPEYPLAVIATRDIDLALAPWREQAIGTAVRTLALSVLAAWLIFVVTRQMARLDAARESLAVSQERFAAAVAGSDDGIWDWDYEKNVSFQSARGREILGLPPGPEVIPTSEWHAAVEACIHPDDAPLRRAQIEAHLAGKTPAYESEFRVKSGAGGYRWVRVRGLCIRNPDGTPRRMAGSASDVDAQRRAEHALRESEERFALAVAGANDGIVDWDIAGDRMFISERAQQVIGIRSESTVQTRAQWSAMLTVHPEDLPRLAESFRWVIEGQGDVREGEYRVRDIDGTWRWIRVRGQHVRDAAGRVVRWAGSVSDIDAQKRVEEALRASEERFALAVAGANQGLWDWDLATDRMFMSPRAQHIMGFGTGEPLRPRREWISLCTYHPEDVARVRAAISDHLHGRTPHLAIEYRVRHPSGEWHWCRQRGIVLRNAEGKPFRMAGSMEEITEAKNAEARRASLEGELLQAKKLEAIGTLAGGIAHDFNNILAAILGYGEMAQKGAPEGTALKRHIDAVVGAGLRAKSLVERILAFSRSGIGERVPVHVQSVVVEALDLFAASMPAHLELERRLCAGDATILGDPTQIHQVIMNLCANGAQAMKAPGALTVTLDVLDKLGAQAATSALPAGRYVRLAVSDAGIGIPRDLKERIFDPFFTTKDVGVGTGLGLSLVHGIVTDLGGGIEVDSREGEGTTVTVYLPLTGRHAAVTGIEEATPTGNGEAILLVDDEEALVRLSEEVVAALGYEPVGFSSSTAALEAFRAEPDRFSAVLSDESMPGMNGSDLAREILAIRPGVPFVLMSGFVSTALASKAEALGIDEVLNKPLVSRDIARSIAAALARARQTEEAK